jgi:hypothetical protein
VHKKMAPSTSRRLRRTGLFFVALAAASFIVPLIAGTQFGKAHKMDLDWFFWGNLLFFPGIGLYLLGRFQYRP